MKVLSLCKDLPSKEFISEIKDKGWIPNVDEWEYLQEPALTETLTTLLGVDLSKIYQLVKSHSPNVVLMEKPFETGTAVEYFEDILFLSTKNLGQGVSCILEVFLMIERKRINVSCEESDCFFCNIKSKKVCTKCTEIAKKADPFSTIRLLLALYLKSDIDSGRLPDILPSLGDVLRNISDINNDPVLSLSATDVLLDAKVPSSSSVRMWLQNASENIYSRKKTLEEGYVSGRSSLFSGLTIFPLRRWNSWTPNLPRISPHDSHGGGYYFYDGSKSLVVDPGYGFIESLYKVHRLTVMDIDSIIISHDHPDHHADLLNILALRFVYKDKCPNKLCLMLNQSSYNIYYNVLRYYSELFEVGYPKLIAPGETYLFNKFEVKTSSMYHKEIFSSCPPIIREEAISFVEKVSGASGLKDSSSIGLSIYWKSVGGKGLKIIIPGDTSFPDEQTDQIEFNNFYADADISFLHIGSIEKKWSDGLALSSSVRYGSGKHLGLNGLLKTINMVKPSIAIVSEFGEELGENGYRASLLEIIKELMLDSSIIVLPADLNLSILYKEDLGFMFNCKCGKYVPISKIDYVFLDNDSIEYSYASGCASSLNHFEI